MVTFHITEPSGPAAPRGPALGTQAGGGEQTPRRGLCVSRTRRDLSPWMPSRDTE